MSQTAISTGHFLEVQPSIRLHMARAGFGATCDGKSQKPLAILLHGFPEYWGAWKDLMPLLGSSHRLIAPDLRGFNLSSKPAGVRAYAAKHVVADILGLIQQLRSNGELGPEEKPILVAHDWGGAIAWNLAAQFGEIFQSLVIINSPHPYTFWRDLRSDPVQQAASQYMNWLRKPGSESLLLENDFARMEGFFVKMGAADWFKGSTRLAYHEAWGQAGAIEGGCNFYRASPLHPPTPEEPGPLGFELDPEAFRVSIPTLVIWGEDDVALPIRLIEGIEPWIDQLTIRRVPGASHWILHERPEQVHDILREWL